MTSRSEPLKITKKQLAEIVELHRLWLLAKAGGRRAYLAGANLTDAVLRGADLRGADLRRADLRRADFTGADLRGAALMNADFTDADLTDAVLRGADLRRAALTGADLRGADLMNADFTGADLRGAALTDVHFQLCPEVGAFDAWKAVTSGVILRLRIPADAKRTSSLVGRKCRCDKAKVIEAWKGEEKLTEGQWPSKHDPSFVYTMGETAKEPNYDDDIRVECTRGIHFFVTRKEAEEWL